MIFFARHLPLIGSEGLEKLKQSCVLIAGVGGLGCIVSELLIRTGVGKLILIDNGIIDEPDLNRQIFYTVNDIGEFKVNVAEKRLNSIFQNKFEYSITVFNKKINFDFLEKVYEQNKIDIIADCVDNFETKLILDDFAYEYEIPFVHAGVDSYFGQIYSFIPKKTKRLKEIYKGLVFKQSSIIKVLPHTAIITGALQSLEIIKIITNNLKFEYEKILTIDLFSYDFDKIISK